MMNIERYRLILTHEYIDKKGAAHRLEDPISVDYNIMSDESNPPKSVIVNEMLERLRHFVLDRIKKEAENV